MGAWQQGMKPVITLLLRIFTLGYFISLISCQTEAQYNLTVTWDCSDTNVNIKVRTAIPFNGIMYADRHRDCFAKGSGSNITELSILLVTDSFESICGQTFDQKTQQTKISVWVRFHSTLELSYDRLVAVTCDKGNVIQMANGAAVLNLNLYSLSNEQILIPVEGEKYLLRAQLSNFADSHDFSVGECKAFSGNSIDNTPLTDQNGCPVDSNIMSTFGFNQTRTSVDALIFSMFRFPNNTRLFIQCIIYVCPAKMCSQTSCPTKSPFNPPKDASRLASSLVVYVQEPGYKSKSDCNYYPWLLGLCIAFGVLFLIMLIINIFMCTAMSCTCTKKVLVEEELEDYDPYKMGWVPESSTYSNRYGSGRGPYSHTSTLESRAPSTSSEQYAVVSSPPSRFSAPSTKDRLGSSISNTYYSSHVDR